MSDDRPRAPSADDAADRVDVVDAADAVDAPDPADSAEAAGPSDPGETSGSGEASDPGEVSDPGEASDLGEGGDADDPSVSAGVPDPDGPRPADDDGGAGGRDVAVPLRVYKAVTVFSTLFAVLAVVAGFVVLDHATQRATAAPEDVDVLVALAGLGSIALGAAVYAFSTRFRARGMGKPKDEAD